MTGAQPAAIRSACSAAPYSVCPLWKMSVSGVLRYFGAEVPAAGDARPRNATGSPSAVVDGEHEPFAEEVDEPAVAVSGGEPGGEDLLRAVAVGGEMACQVGPAGWGVADVPGPVDAGRPGLVGPGEDAEAAPGEVAARLVGCEELGAVEVTCGVVGSDQPGRVDAAGRGQRWWGVGHDGRPVA